MTEEDNSTGGSEQNEEALDLAALYGCLKTIGMNEAKAKKFTKRHELENLLELVDCGWSHDDVKRLVKIYNEGLSGYNKTQLELGQKTEKRLKALAWWLTKQKVYGLPLDHTLWTAQQMEWSMQEVAAYELAVKQEKVLAPTPGLIESGIGYDEWKL